MSQIDEALNILNAAAEQSRQRLERPWRAGEQIGILCTFIDSVGGLGERLEAFLEQEIRDGEHNAAANAKHNERSGRPPARYVPYPSPEFDQLVAAGWRAISIDHGERGEAFLSSPIIPGGVS